MCIRFLGNCLCPYCLVQKMDVIHMGTRDDIEMRAMNVQVSNEAWMAKVKKASKYIFCSGAGVNGDHVNEILQNESLVPTYVSCYLTLHDWTANRTCST